MDELYNLYSNKILAGANETYMFTKFFVEDRKYVENWVNKCFKNLEGKNNNKAEKLKETGNKFYINKNFNKSLEFYTRALCHAIPESENFGTILANRSAVLYMMEDYESCIKDIICFTNCNHPESIKLKVFIRKIKCYAKMQMQDKLNDAVMQTLQLLDGNIQIKEKDKYQKIIVEASAEKPSVNHLRNKCKDVPKPKDDFNEKFLFASSAIRLAYNEVQGRHVVANKQLQEGDVLFVEKPFIFAPVFVNEDMELSFNKCFNCLQTALSCLPCKYCTKCIFCDEKCRNVCWNEFHKWECIGMQANLWYHIGIAFPALRALIRGTKSGLQTLSDDYKADTLTYGNKSDNYSCFNKLVSNIPKMKNVIPIVISSTIVVLYLKNQTKFFEWLMDQPGFEGKQMDELIGLIGGRLTKHIAQLQCNASVISHDDTAIIEESSTPVASAIYPSISMMNHSCKPNITINYIQDVAVAKAAETIEENEEIVNCYGIDYRQLDWQTRQEYCMNLYYFKCKCRACKYNK